MKSVRPAFHPALHRRFDLSAPPAQLRNRQANKFALVNPNVARYMDSVNGSDSTGDGTISKPYMTLAKCRDSITDQSEFKVYTVFVLNSGVITEAPILNWATFINISGPGWLFTAINTPITVAVADGEQGWLEIEGISLGGDSSSDYAFTYDGTNADIATLKLFDTFVAGLLYRTDAGNRGYLQTNGGVLGYKTTLRGNVVLRGTDLFNSWEVEESQGQGSFVEIIGSSMNDSHGGSVGVINGNSTVILAGCTPPVSITGSPSATDTPTLQVDPGSVPSLLIPPINLRLVGDLSAVKYTPGTPAQWATPAPTNASDALDRLTAAVFALNGNTPIS